MNDVEYEWYEETGFPVIAYGSQARGYFARFASGEPQGESPAKYYACWPANARRAQRAAELAGQLGISAAAVSLAYVRASSLNVSALAGFSSVAQLEESFQALQVDLTPEQAAYLQTGK